MTKEPQEEINRLMNEKLNADKMSLNPPLKFEPQEEWEEDVKKFCKKYGWSEEELYKEPMHTYSDLCMKEMDDDFKKLEDADFRHENYIQQFIQKHIVSAYNYGYKAGEEEAVKEFLKPKGMPNFHKAVETLRNKQIQQAISEERERLRKIVEEYHHSSDETGFKYVSYELLLQELQNK
jgi:hypothetical protein